MRLNALVNETVQRAAISSRTALASSYKAHTMQISNDGLSLVITLLPYFQISDCFNRRYHYETISTSLRFGGSKIIVILAGFSEKRKSKTILYRRNQRSQLLFHAAR